jgi:hypothetical protein
MANQWGADVPISMPQPLRADQEAIVPMGGFVMTTDGLWPDMSAADHERLATPSYAPYNPTGVVETVPGPEEG